MNRETSLYLDFVRFGAALAVFLSHMGQKRLTAGFLWQAVPYGAEAVMVFFVLSGFVIAYVTDGRENSARQYAVNRAARLYSVVVPALLLTAVLDTIGKALRPDLYTGAWGYLDWNLPEQFIRALTFTHEVWSPIRGPGSNIPFWSLGFEVPYYLIFALAIFARPAWRGLAVGIAVLLVGPEIAGLLPIWLMGVAAYHVCKRVSISRSLGKVLLIAPVILWAINEVYLWQVGHFPPGSDRVHHIDEYLIGALFATHLVGFHTVSDVFAGVLNRCARPIRWLAGATFSIYLYHLPVATFLTTVMGWDAGSWQSRTVLMLGVLPIVLLLAEFTERRKEPWRRLFTRLLGPRSCEAA
ncbi:acyltransferase [Roseomonas nepalensis]|uniref:Acyltransferase n=1 Tax=Muricoccus nepalensis TaxID=1854500 RepID=A0A502F705_9PROT|nr:acyltransferase [Roseomonas nepalensis]TPG44911.1 acyltransferase [Roseomonas nepalensis]